MHWRDRRGKLIRHNAVVEVADTSWLKAGRGRPVMAGGGGQFPVGSVKVRVLSAYYIGGKYGNM